MTVLCIVPTCTLDGLVDATVTLDDGSTATGLACFPHAYPFTPETDPSDNYRPEGWTDPASTVDLLPPEPVDDRAFHVDVTAGLAAMLLEHAAMAIGDDDTSADDAMVSLAGNTAFTNDVAAGILVALTWIAAAGGVTANMLLEGAQVYEQMADTEEAAVDAYDDEDHGQVFAGIAAILLDRIAAEVDRACMYCHAVHHPDDPNGCGY